MSFTIDTNSYSNKLKKQIEDISSSMINIQSNPSSIGSISGGNTFGVTGISSKAIQQAKSTDVFTTAKMYGGNNTTASQSNQNQNTVSNSTTQFMTTFVSQVKNDAVTKLKTAISQLQAKLESTPTEQSAIASNPTSGQSVTPKDNMPLDNQGGDKKAAGAEDNQRPNVKVGGEETIEDKTNPDNIENENKPEVKEQEQNTALANNSTQLDKAAQKESDKQLQDAQQKIQQKFKHLQESVAA